MVDYREQVMARLEQAGYAEPSRGGDGDEVVIDSDFVLECLSANELGDGILYAALHKGRFIFVKNFGEWFCWRGHYWAPDDYDEAIAAVEMVAIRYAKELDQLNERLEAAIAAGKDGKLEADRLGKVVTSLRKRVVKLRSSRGRENCLKFAHTNPVNQLAVHAREFDANPWLLACKNGVIDLRTGKLRPGRQEDYISKHCPIDWKGLDADAGPFYGIVQEIFDHDNAMVKFMQRLYGYGITGLVVEHVFSVHHGAGRNGKGLMFDMFMRALGDYAGPIPSEMLLDSSRGASPNQTSPELLALKGMRLAIASETDEGRRFSAAKVKWLTGGDRLTARGLYDKKPTKFDPTHLLVLLTNNRPDAPGTDSAFWDRCLLVHHRIKFTKTDPKLPNERKGDKMLYVTLLDYLPGILAWLVRGCLEWQERGLDPPESVRDAVNEYREDENYIGQFLKACCELGEDYNVGAKELYALFERWYVAEVNKNERFVPSKKKFGKLLMATELFKKKRPGGMIKYYGLRIRMSAISTYMGGDDGADY